MNEAVMYVGAEPREAAAGQPRTTLAVHRHPTGVTDRSLRHQTGLTVRRHDPDGLNHRIVSFRSQPTEGSGSLDDAIAPSRHRLRPVDQRPCAAAFNALFADGAQVNDNGREFRGRDAIKDWSDRAIFAARVTLEVLDVADRGGETVITTKVDGNFDRTGLPDPVIINHHISLRAARSLD